MSKPDPPSSGTEPSCVEAMALSTKRLKIANGASSVEKIGFWRGFKTYPAAAAWSIVLSSSILNGRL